MASFRSLISGGIGGNNNNNGSGSGGNSRKQQQKTNDDVEFLLKTIDDQNEQIARLQSKFRDVTHAYKSLLAEKKALEITLKTLKSSPSTFVKPTASAATKPSSGSQLSASSRSVSISDVSEQEYNEAASSTDPSSRVSVASSSPDSGVEKSSSCRELADSASADDKVAALMSNMQVLMEAKSSMEQSYLAEKKKMRADFEDLKNQLKTSKTEQEKTVEGYESKIKELRSSLKQSQADREKLVQDMNAMMKAKSNEQDSKIMSMNEETQTILIDLRNENNELKGKLKNLSKQFENKCEEVIQCDKDYKQLKSFNEQQVKDYESRVQELNSEIRDLTSSSELRINDLEAKVSDMCRTIASYENEHSKSSSSSSSQNKSEKKLAADDDPVKSLDFDAAIEQISQLKSFIESTARDLNINFNFNEIWLQPGINCQQQQLQQRELQDQLDKLKEENRTLKDEFEKHKIRTNYLIKTAKQSSKEPSPPTKSSQEDELQQQVKKLKDEVDLCKKRMSLMEKESQDEMQALKEVHETEMRNQRNEFKSKLEKCENEKMKSINDLEKELVKQRERTIKLLSEKDAEVQRYRESSSTATPTFASVFSDNRSSVSPQRNTAIDDQAAESNANNTATESEEEPLHQNLQQKHHRRHQTPTPSAEANRLIHYTQESAYKDLELNKLRVAKNELEYQLKQTCDEHSVDIDRFQSQIGVLKQEIERLKLNQTRNEMNGANLEYVKNVVFNLITTKDKNVKIAMVNAITQILQFTKTEKQRIQSISNKF